MDIQSMTGFGQFEDHGIRVELRSVNHRFLDTYFRIPQFFNPYEIKLRNMIKKRLSRGRVDVTVLLTEEADIKIELNKKIAQDVIHALQGVKEDLSLKDGPSLDHLFWFREILFTEAPDYKPDDLYYVFEEALNRLVEMRQKEGEVLTGDVREMLNKLHKHYEEVRNSAEEMLEKNLKLLKRRISTLLEDSPVDDSRMLQEAAFLAEKADISEELTRVQSHYSQVTKILHDGGEVGRRLDFLLQELLREINTIGSKSTEFRISDLVVQMKAVVEKVKEQVQNIQ